MNKQIDEIQKLKLKKLSEELSALWDSLTPSEQRRMIVFNTFLDLQKQIPVIQNKNYALNEKE